MSIPITPQISSYSFVIRPAFSEPSLLQVTSDLLYVAIDEFALFRLVCNWNHVVQSYSVIILRFIHDVIFVSSSFCY